ncbi:flagellar motor switch protein FliM [Oribacterium sp. oral taxon 102]|uniref:flagellar motor switch protein FliM n=1 Tax=Oribacterium sp. oral taxon 102 TaxID=671214 RepID=UPI0015B98D98|nr:FliM/FliN family flagellar motor switch protein [Oribacterium sp. oral taxon 102]NWO21805.1 flagellar motor switch protein FliM [Oribacterium sp. oral taxon 102]
MAEVLSQSQIDALLKSMKDSPAEPEAKPEKQVVAAAADTKEEGYNKYDFYSPRKFTKEKMKLLKSIFENYARILTSQVNGIFRTMTDITVLDLRETRYYEYVNFFHENDCMTLVDTYVRSKGKSNVPMMIYITPGLTLTLVSHMLGGSDSFTKVEENYRYSDVEMALYRRILEYITHALGDGFSNYISAEFRISRVEENPSMVQEVGLDETVVMAEFNVDVSGLAAEKIRLCLPGSLLEHIFKIIDNRKHLARGFAYENNEETILEHLRGSEFPMTGQLGVVKLDIRDLYHLRVGDVIDLNKPKDSTVRLYVGKQPWFTGRMGVYKKNIAVRIEDRIMQKNEETEEGNDGSWETTPGGAPEPFQKKLISQAEKERDLERLRELGSGEV